MSLVIFDMDGVLVDSETLACRTLAAHLAEVGVTLSFAEVVRTFVGLSGVSACAIYRDRFGMAEPEAFHARVRAKVHQLFATELRAMPHVDDVLATLAILRRPICVASSSLPDNIALSLRLTGLDRHFGGRLYSSSMVARGKPAPDLFLHAAAEMGARPADTVVVEDSLPGIQAGQAAGMRVLAFAGGAHVDAAAQAAAGAEVFDDMRALPGLLAG